jgi:hypothetical protein
LAHAEHVHVGLEAIRYIAEHDALKNARRAPALADENKEVKSGKQRQSSDVSQL